VTDVLNEISGLVTGFVDKFSTLATDALDEITGFVSDVLEEVGGLATDIRTKASEVGSAIVSGIQNSITAGATSIGNTIFGAVSSAVNGISGIQNTVAGIGKDIVDGIINKVQSAFDLVGTLKIALSDAALAIATGRTAVLEGAKDIGGEIVDAIINGLGDLADIFLDPIESGINSAIDGINSIFPGKISTGSVKMGTGPLSALPGLPQQLGPVSLNVPGIPISDLSLDTGGFIEETGLATVHEGERVVPDAQVSDRGAVSVETAGVDSETLDSIDSRLASLNEVMRDDGTARVRERDVVRALEQLFDRYGGTV
jgi:hypothetical protein